MQTNIISFSLFGEKVEYQIGALENLDLSKKWFPDWVCRFYVDDAIPNSLLETLVKGGAQVVKKTQNAHFYEGLFWRFLAIGDADVGQVIIRDIDARLGFRDKQAVTEWLKSGQDFHIVRDHPGHKAPILAGIWGAKGGMINDIEHRIEAYLKGKKELPFDSDQWFLSGEIYPKIRRRCLIHSEFVQFRGESVRPISTPRDSVQWLGMPISFEKKLMIAKTSFLKQCEQGLIRYRLPANWQYHFTKKLEPKLRRHPRVMRMWHQVSRKKNV